MPTADELLGRDVARALLGCLRRAAPTFAFPETEVAVGRLDGLALSARVFALRDAMLRDLGDWLDEVETTVRAALGDDAFDGWMTWPVGEAVAVSALAAGDPAAFARGLELLRLLTPRLTSEFAIRAFLRHDLDDALAVMRPWATDPDPAVRRLVSEGTRPRLPWAKRVPEIFERPEAAAPLLDALHRDEDEVVRRSVANHVNDISRIRPELAVELCRRWSRTPDPHTARLVRHALRTLVKEAHPGALALLGFGSADELEVTGPVLVRPDDGSASEAAPTHDGPVGSAHAADGGQHRLAVPAGGELAFTVAVRNAGAAPVQVAVDYVVHYRKASGALAPKVFKIAVRTLGPGETAHFERRRSFQELTTRRHHPGEHAIEAQVNGRRFGRVAFELGG